MDHSTWIMLSTILLGVTAMAFTKVWEKTYYARNQSSDEKERRKGEVIWTCVILIATVAVVYVLTGSVFATCELKGERVEIEESLPLAAVGGNSYISGNIGGGSFAGTGYVSGGISEDDYYTLMVGDGNGGYKKRKYRSDDVTVMFDAAEEDARVEEVNVVRDYVVTRYPLLAFVLKYENREIEHQTRIHVPENSYGDHQFDVN